MCILCFILPAIMTPANFYPVINKGLSYLISSHLILFYLILHGLFDPSVCLGPPSSPRFPAIIPGWQSCAPTGAAEGEISPPAADGCDASSDFQQALWPWMVPQLGGGDMITHSQTGLTPPDCICLCRPVPNLRLMASVCLLFTAVSTELPLRSTSKPSCQRLATADR